MLRLRLTFPFQCLNVPEESEARAEHEVLCKQSVDFIQESRSR